MPTKAIGSTEVSKTKRTMRLDVADKDLKGVSVGDSVTVTVKGKVTELEASRTYDYGPDGTDKIPATIGLQVSSTKVAGKNEFAAMAQQDMDETDGD